MDFLSRLSKEEIQTFLSVLNRNYEFFDEITLRNIKKIKMGVYAFELFADNEFFSMCTSDENIKFKSSNPALNKEETKKLLKLEWSAFLVAKFGAEYISKKFIFKPSQTVVFKYIEKYSKALSYLKPSQKLQIDNENLAKT